MCQQSIARFVLNSVINRYPGLLIVTALMGHLKDKQQFEAMLQHLPAILAENTEHFPLFSRYWYHLTPLVQPGLSPQAEAINMLLAAMP
jgi:hypothetical protein